jgi:U3 small nucleolar RNA-associated protein 7
VAQRKYAYIYDQAGTELHRLEHMNTPLALDFLPFHFLLRYQDTSTGDYVANIYTKLGGTSVLRQNPWNAVSCLGHSKGVVSMWAPNTSKPLVQMQCHGGPVTALAVDNTGHYMVTAGQDSTMKVWDLRTYQQLYQYHTPTPAVSLDVSQRGVVAVGCGGVVEMWKETFSQEQSAPYMRHRLPGQRAESVRFAPFEDFLGVGHSSGFSSVVVPGSGEPNFDSFAANPYQTAKQRSEAEVRGLLDKIQPDMIQLDPTLVGSLARRTLYEEAPANDFQEAPALASKMKNKMRGKNSAGKRANRKQQNVWDQNRQLLKEKQERQRASRPAKDSSSPSVPKALSRFK